MTSSWWWCKCKIIAFLQHDHYRRFKYFACPINRHAKNVRFPTKSRHWRQFLQSIWYCCWFNCLAQIARNITDCHNYILENDFKEENDLKIGNVIFLTSNSVEEIGCRKLHVKPSRMIRYTSLFAVNFSNSIELFYFEMASNFLNTILWLARLGRSLSELEINVVEIVLLLLRNAALWTVGQ